MRWRWLMLCLVVATPSPAFAECSNCPAFDVTCRLTGALDDLLPPIELPDLGGLASQIAEWGSQLGPVRFARELWEDFGWIAELDLPSTGAAVLTGVAVFTGAPVPFAAAEPSAFPDPTTIPLSANPSAQSEYAPTTLPLWADGGPDPSADVLQGGLGDCYFMSSLAGLSPDMARDMIQVNSDGTVTVRLFSTDALGRSTPVFVRITTDLPVDAGARYPDTLWPALVEKAYAAHLGSYDAIVGDVNLAFFTAPTVITGRPTAAFYLPALARIDEDAPLRIIEDALQAGEVLFVGNTGTLDDGLYADHAYTVLGTHTGVDGTVYVKLRNPWGYSEPGNDGVDDGIFELPLDAFSKNFPYLVHTVGGG